MMSNLMYEFRYSKRHQNQKREKGETKIQTND